MVDNSIYNILTSRMNTFSFHSFINILPDPDYILAKAGKTVQVYNEILADSHVTSCVNTRKSGTKKLKYRINQNNSNTNTLTFYEQIFNSLDMTRIISEILNAPLFGFQVSEIIWQKQNDKIIPINVKGRSNEYFHFDIDDKLRFKSKSNPNGELLPDHKILLTQYNNINDNPYGERLLSKCFWPVFFKKNGFKFFAVFIEKYAMPAVIAKTPREIELNAKQELLNELESMVQDGIIVIPEDSDVSFLDASSRSSSSNVYKELIEQCENEISKVILGQTLTTQLTGQQGSFAAAKVHNDVKQDIIDSDKELVESTINTLIKYIHHFNFSNSNYPDFELYEEDEIDPALTKTLTECGVKFTKDYFIHNYNLKNDWFDMTQQQPAPAPDITTAAFSQQITDITDENKNDSQLALDKLISSFSTDELIKQTIPMLEPIINSIKNNTADYNELLAKLAEIYPQMDDSELIEKLTRAYFIADCWGRISVENESQQ